MSLMCNRLFVGLCGLVVVCPTVLADALTDPFATANRNPFVDIYGLPPAQGGALLAAGQVSTELVLEAANSFTFDSAGGEQIFIDGETHIAELRARWGVGDRWELGAMLPWRSHEGGGLDGFIDDWHDGFGLPDGDRPDYPADELHYRYGSGAGTAVDIHRSTDGIGDVSLSAGYRLSAAGSQRQWALRAGVSLPTGDADDLLGSESTDLSLALHVSDNQWLAGQGLVWHGSIGALWMTEGEVLDQIREDWVMFASATLAWMATDNVSLKLQLDGHSAFYDSALTQLGDDSVQLSLGGAVRLSRDWVVDLAVVEDLAVDTAPDVVFHIGLKGPTF